MAHAFAMTAGGQCAFRGDCSVLGGRQQAIVAQRGALQVLPGSLLSTSSQLSGAPACALALSLGQCAQGACPAHWAKGAFCYKHTVLSQVSKGSDLEAG